MFLKTGFSLLELLLALLLIAIFTVLTMPNWHHLIAENQAAAEVREVIAALQLARNVAVTRGQNVTFCKSADHKACGGSWHDGQIVLTKGGEVLRVLATLPPNVTFSWQSSLGKDEALEFAPSGTTNGQQGSFYYCPRQAPDAARAIIINFNGRILVSNKTSAGEKIPCQ
jgi:type IV fimbrial biogenesis protein FimT